MVGWAGSGSGGGITRAVCSANASPRAGAVGSSPAHGASGLITAGVADAGAANTGAAASGGDGDTAPPSGAAYALAGGAAVGGSEATCDAVGDIACGPAADVADDA